MTTDPHLSRPIEAWPEIDRRGWEAGRTSGYLATQKATSIAEMVSGYGRWIAFLAARGELDERTDAAGRVTPDLVRNYILAMRGRHYQNTTIETRLLTLGAALRVLAPDRSFTWLHPWNLLRGHSRRGRPLENNDPTRHWPEIDRRIWTAGLQGGDILTGANRAVQLRPATILHVAQAYGGWLAFLRREAMLDPQLPPMARVTRERVMAYVDALRKTNRNRTIIGICGALRTALRIMHPDADFGWITSPGGRPLTSVLPVTPRAIPVFHSKVLYEWGLAMMRDALLIGNPDARRRDYRNGLLIALFAARAPRVRSMASLRLGASVIRNGDTWQLIFESDDVKTKRRIAYDLPMGLSGAMQRYIAVEREELLAGKTHDWFWVNQYGGPLTVRYMQKMIRCRSKKAFGRSFGPHRFRHAMGTTAPLTDPAHAGVAAAILGISERMVEAHYNLARQADVASKFHASLRKNRAATQSVARREFGRCGTKCPDRPELTNWPSDTGLS
jgi:integrase